MLAYKNNYIPSQNPFHFINSLPTATVLIDKKGKIKEINSLASALLGATPDRLIGRPLINRRWNMVDTFGNPLIAAQTLLSDLPNHKNDISELEIGIICMQGLRWLSLHTSPLLSDADEYQGAFVSFFDITDKKNTEKKLQQREQWLLSITESQTSYVIRTDLNGHFVYLNNAALQHFGYSADELLNQPVYSIMDRNSTHQCMKAKAYCLENPSRPTSIEVRCHNKQQEYFWTTWELVGVCNEQGEVTEIQAVGRDVSRKKRESALLADTSRMARVGGWEINELTKQISWTPETYRIHDLPEGSPVTLKRSIHFYHPDDRPIIRKALRNMLLRGESFDLKLRMVTAQKRNVWVRVIGQYESIYGNYTRAYGVIQDVTASQLTEERIRQREWLLKSVFNSTADALFLIDLKGKFIDCNESALRIFEVDRKKDILGKYGMDFQKKPFSELESETIRDTVSNAGVWRSEEEFITAKNMPFWGNLAITAFKGADFGVMRVTDITDQKDAEALLIESNQHLQKVNEELDRFVYSASHDLRAPLTSIMGLITLSEMEEMGEALQDYLQHMKKSANRLDTFITDLTHFSRNARLEVKVEAICFEEIVQVLFEQYQFIDHTIPVKTLLEVSQTNPFYSDHSRLQVVLGNIISNALKYTREQEEESYVKVKVSVIAEEAIIHIIDNGIGIDPTYIEKIFDMFYRANHFKPGSGLGLYIVKETLEKLKGTIKVSSTLEKGTRFTIRIPSLQSET